MRSAPLRSIAFIAVAWSSTALATSATEGAASSAPLPTILNAQCSTTTCQTVGGFAPPFVEPVIYSVPGVSQNMLPIENPMHQTPVDGRCAYDDDDHPVECKPAGTAVSNLPDGRVLFWNELEGTENVEFSILIEGSSDIVNDQSRVLTLDAINKLATWTVPGPADGSITSSGNRCLLPGCLLNTDPNETNPSANRGALFCADLTNLYDGRVITVGGANYFAEPGVTLTTHQGPYALGLIEMDGMKSTRIFDPASNEWFQTGNMTYGRWYPSLATLPSGDLFVASGVTKLVKPIYPDHLLTSGRNVAPTETFDLHTGTWHDNGGMGQRSLPLYPRLHLLPNGQVYYAGGGQSFAPFGEGYDQALWNIVGAYNPATGIWTDLAYAGLPLQINKVGIPQIVSGLNPTNPLALITLTTQLTSLIGTTLTDPASQLSQIINLINLNGGSLVDRLNTVVGSGMRGSTFSVMMPLMPNASNKYERADFLTAGGTISAAVATSPGTFLATNLSRLETVNMAGGQMLYSSQLTGALQKPRWFGTPALLPTGQVMLFNGANTDEVVLPGIAQPIMQAEMYDPATMTWKTMATQNHARTYHNTALLLQDGSVLLGGHAPANTAYLFSINIPLLNLSPNVGRDPSFEIYYPPYMFYPRPSISVPPPTRLSLGQTFTLGTPQASSIASAVLIRRTSITHDVNSDQRSVVLPIVSRTSSSITMLLSTNAAAIPPGTYMLFINQNTSHGLSPSTSVPMTISGTLVR